MNTIKLYGNDDHKVTLSLADEGKKKLSQSSELPEFLLEVNADGLREILDKSPQVIRKITRIG